MAIALRQARAAGDTRSVMVASVAGDDALLIPLGRRLSVRLRLGLPGLYLAWTAFALLYAALLHRRRRTGIAVTR